MAKKIIVSAISNMVNTPTVKPSFAVNGHENAMEASKDKAPILLSVPTAGSVKGAELAHMIAADADSIGEAEAARWLNGLGEKLVKCAEEAINVQLGFVTFELSVAGSLESGDEPIDPDTNYLQYTGVVSDDLRKLFASIETRIDSAEVGVDVKRVRDVATGKGAIVATNPFHLKGVKMTYGAPGEKIELLKSDKETKLVDVVVDDHASEIEFECRLADAVEAGRHYIKVTTLAGGKSTLYPVGTFVEVENEELTIEKIHSEALDEDGACAEFGDQLVITGTGFVKGMGAAYVIRDAAGRELARQPKSSSTAFIRTNAHRATFEINENESGVDASVWRENRVFVALTVGDKTVEFPVEWKQA